VQDLDNKNIAGQANPQWEISMNLSRSFALTLAVLLSQQIQAQTMPAPETVRLDELQLMEGFPPSANKQVTAQNFLTQFPNLRWAFHHMRELLPSRNIRRSPSASVALPPGEDLRARIDGLNFVGPEDKSLTFGE
jgi:hypothetical protein